MLILNAINIYEISGTILYYIELIKHFKYYYKYCIQSFY